MDINLIIGNMTKGVNPVVVSYYKHKAITNIRQYLNKEPLSDEEILNTYGIVICELVEHYKNLSEKGNMTSITQGQLTVHYENDSSLKGIPNYIKALLPAPYMKVRK